MVLRQDGEIAGRRAGGAAVTSLRRRHNSSSTAAAADAAALMANSNRHANQRRQSSAAARAPTPGQSVVIAASRQQRTHEDGAEIPGGRRWHRRIDVGDRQETEVTEHTHYRHDYAVLCQHPITPDWTCLQRTSPDQSTAHQLFIMSDKPAPRPSAFCPRNERPNDLLTR